MRRRLLLIAAPIVLGIFLMPIAAFAGGLENAYIPAEYMPYTDNDSSFELLLPTAWQISENNEDGTIVAVTYINEGQEVPVSVNVTAAISESTFKAEIADIRKNFPKLIPGYKKKIDKAYKVKGAQARVFGGTFKVGENLLRLEQLFVMKDQKIFVVTASAKNSDWAKYKKDFAKIFKSFKVLSFVPAG